MNRYVVVGSLALLVFARSAMAETFVVTSMRDTGPGSLTFALGMANETVEHDTITFDASVSGLLTFTGVARAPLTIEGPGRDKLTLRSTMGSNGNNVVLTIRNVTFDGANAGGLGSLILEDVDFINDGVVQTQGDTEARLLTMRRVHVTGAVNRPAVLSAGSDVLFEDVVIEDSPSCGLCVVTGYQSPIIIRRSVFRNNGNSFAGGGAAIDLRTGILSVSDSLFEGNTASTTGAGAIQSSSPFPVTIERSVFVRNSGPLSGAVAGLRYESKVSSSLFVGNSSAEGAGAFESLSVDADHLTIVGNTSANQLAAFSSAGSLSNSVVMQNTGGDLQGFSGLDVRYSIYGTSVGTIVDGAGNLAAAIDPQLLPLETYGDARFVSQPPRTGSPLVDAGDPEFVATDLFDVLGNPRTIGARTDIGAVEITACGLEGAQCDDGNACTTGDTCSAGTCLGTAVAGCPAEMLDNGGGETPAGETPADAQSGDDGGGCVAVPVSFYAVLAGLSLIARRRR